MILDARIAIELLEEREPFGRSPRHRDRHRVVQRDHRVVGHTHEHAVERDDLRPVRVVGARGFVVHRRDRGLQEIRAHRAARHRVGHELHALRDRFLVPERSILLVERDDLAVRSRSRGAPRVGEEHEREEAAHLAAVREELVRRAREADRFTREIHALVRLPRARGVALVEDEIEHVEDGAEARVSLLGRRHHEAHAGALDALLRAADSLRHRRLGHEERARDLRRGETTHRAQRQRDRGRTRERRMAAHEEKNERVVLFHGCFVGRRYHVLFRRCFEDDLRFAPAARRLRPDLIGELSRGDLDEPRARIFGHAGARPLERSRGERFLHCVLRGAEVAVATDDGAEHLRCKLTEQVLAGRFHRGSARPRASRAARSSPDAPRS